MTKTELVRFEYGVCAECPHVDNIRPLKWKCLLKRRLIPNLWGKIPDWCPLEEKKC